MNAEDFLTLIQEELHESTDGRWDRGGEQRFSGERIGDVVYVKELATGKFFEICCVDSSKENFDKACGR